MENEFSNRISVKNIVLAGMFGRIPGGYVPGFPADADRCPDYGAGFCGCTGWV